jgi:hypothetical protein
MAMTKEQWDDQQNASKKKYKYIPTGKPGEVKMVEDNEEDEKNPDDENSENESPITPKHKEDWNKYLGWLKEKGMQGKPELDKGGVGEKLFQEYLKQNPETSLSKSIIPGIRKEYVNMRDKAIEEMKAGKGGWGASATGGKEADYSGFMKHILDNEKSGDPNYVGQHLTMTPFPLEKLPQGQGGRPTGISRYSN